MVHYGDVFVGGVALSVFCFGSAFAVAHFVNHFPIYIYIFGAAFLCVAFAMAQIVKHFCLY